MAADPARPATINDAHVASDTAAPVSPASPAGDHAAKIAKDAQVEPQESETTSAAGAATKPPALRPKPRTSSATSTKSARASAASQAETAAHGPLPGSAGAGGPSHEEKGNAAASSYQAALAAHLRQYRDFPSAAQDQGIHGVARVTFTVTASGGLAAASLNDSSGFSILDQAALAMVRRAAPYPAIPPELGRRTVTVTVPIRFDLQ
jgi:protein TonB